MCVCVYPQRAEASEALQHAVMHVLQPVGGQNQLVDPRSSFKRALLYVGDAVVAQVAASGQSRRKIKTSKTRQQENAGRAETTLL